MTAAGKPYPQTRSFPIRKLNVLLVDDDDTCIFIHRRVLERSGYCNTAHSASNGKTALELLSRDAPFPDIIFLDLEMPVMNGIAFLKAFRGLGCPHKKDIAVVLLTSSVSTKDHNLALSLGATHVLTKPFTQEKLEQVLANTSLPSIR